jgi:hypothetical protein
VTLRRQSKATGLWLPDLEEKNTIQAAGIHLLIDRLRGVTGETVQQRAAASLQVGNAGWTGTPGQPGGPVTISTKDGEPNVPPRLDNNSLPKAIWKWKDETPSEYAADRIRIFLNGVLWADLSPGWGSKPSSQNWFYTYTVEPASGDGFIGAVGDPTYANLYFPGMWRFLMHLTGERYGDMSLTTLWMVATDDAGGVHMPQPGTPVGPAPGFPFRDGATLKTEFLAGSTVDPGNWKFVSVHIGSGNEAGLFFRRQLEYGTKDANATWRWPWDMVLASV